MGQRDDVVEDPLEGSLRRLTVTSIVATRRKQLTPIPPVTNHAAHAGPSSVAPCLEVGVAEGRSWDECRQPQPIERMNDVAQGQLPWLKLRRTKPQLRRVRMAAQMFHARIRRK